MKRNAPGRADETRGFVYLFRIGVDHHRSRVGILDVFFSLFIFLFFGKDILEYFVRGGEMVIFLGLSL